MANTSQVPRFVRVRNALTTSLLRAGVRLASPFVFFRYHLRADRADLWRHTAADPGW
jgi:hypothetical protein